MESRAGNFDGNVFSYDSKSVIRIPSLALMDADPHGLDILLVYKFGSQGLRHEGHMLESPNLKWLGLRFREIAS
jgi:DNA topoisomerase VI subunit A